MKYFETYQQNARHGPRVVSTNDAAVNIFGVSLDAFGYPRRYYWIKGIIAKRGTLGSTDVNLTKAHKACCQIALDKSCSNLPCWNWESYFPPLVSLE